MCINILTDEFHLCGLCIKQLSGNSSTLYSCLAQAKQSASCKAVENKKFTHDVSCQLDGSVNCVTENTVNQQSSIQQLNTTLSDNLSTGMEVCTYVQVYKFPTATTYYT